MQDAAGKLGGSLIFSTSSTGSTSTGSGQLVDRLTIDSNGLATFASSISMLNPTGTLTVSGSALLNTLSTTGNTAIGTTSSQTLTINAATSFASAVTATAPVSITAGNNFNALGNAVIGTDSSNTLTVAAATTFRAAVTANAPVTVSTGNLFAAYGNIVLGTDNGNTVSISSPTTFSSSASVTANGNVVLGASSTQTLTVRAMSTFAAPLTANAAVTIAAGNTLSALGNATIGSSNANSLMVNANATFAGSATFSQAFQLYSNSSSPSSSSVLGFQRQNSAAAVGSGFTLGSILFSGYDGVVQGPTAQIRSVFTVWPRLVSMFIKPFDHVMSVEGHSDCSLLSAVPVIAKCQSAKNLHLTVQSQLCCSLHIYLMLVVRAQPHFGCSTHASDSCITCVHAYICVSVHNYSAMYKVYLDLCLTVLSYLHGQ